MFPVGVPCPPSEDPSPRFHIYYIYICIIYGVGCTHRYRKVQVDSLYNIMWCSVLLGELAAMGDKISLCYQTKCRPLCSCDNNITSQMQRTNDSSIQNAPKSQSNAFGIGQTMFFFVSRLHFDFAQNVNDFFFCCSSSCGRSFWSVVRHHWCLQRELENELLIRVDIICWKKSGVKGIVNKVMHLILIYLWIHDFSMGGFDKWRSKSIYLDMLLDLLKFNVKC